MTRGNIEWTLIAVIAFSLVIIVILAMGNI